MKKRWLSLLLTLCMVLTLLPVSAFAADIVASGNCGAQGDNVTWTLDSNGVMTISGNGEMMDYHWIYSNNEDTESAPDTPWYDHRDSIKKLIIKPGVTTIGMHTAYDCSNLTDVSIPDSISSIRGYSFTRCSKLDNISIPEGLPSIESSTFAGCKSLTSITIPDSVFKIDQYAFSGCSSLKQIKLSENLTSIGREAFKSCTSMTEIILPDSVSKIGYSAFGDCSYLEHISLPSSLKVLGNSIFVSCSRLNHVVIPDGVEEIGPFAFFLCHGLTDVSIPDSVTTIQYRAFEGCNRLESITIPDSVTKIGAWAFIRCMQLKNVKLPANLSTLSDGLFSDCRELVSIELPDSISKIEQGAFSKCIALEEITLPKALTAIANETFSGCTALKRVFVPLGISKIGRKAFNACDQLEGVYYEGLPLQWSSIYIDPDNAILNTAPVHFQIGREDGFNPERDAWSFRNSRLSFGYPSNYTIPLERYEEVFGKQYVAAATTNESRNQAMIIDKWYGNCSGMAMTSSLFHLGMLNWPNYSTQYLPPFQNVNQYYTAIKKTDLNRIYIESEKDSQITKLIEQYQILMRGFSLEKRCRLMNEVIKNDAFYTSNWSYKTMIHNPNGDYILHLAEELVEAIQNDIPLYLAIAGSSGHALVLRTDTDICLTADGWLRFPVYDPNHPYFPLSSNPDISQDHLSSYYLAPSTSQYIELNIKENKWRYVYGSNYRGCDENGSVKYITENECAMPECLYAIDVTQLPTHFDGTDRYWDTHYPGNVTETVSGAAASLLVEASTNAIVRASSGAVLAQIFNGTGFPMADDVFFIPNLSAADDDSDSGTGGKLYLPEQDFTIEYINGDLAVIGNGCIMSLSMDSASQIDVSTEAHSVSVKSQGTGAALIQITEKCDDSGYAVGCATGSIETNDTLALSLTDASLMLEYDLQDGSSLDIYTNSDLQPGETFIKTISGSEEGSSFTVADIREVQTSVFADVSPTAYYADAVTWAAENGITTGVTPTAFMPDRVCTRAHVVTFLWRANGCPEPKATTNSFKDVPNGKYYTKAVLWASEQGITTGYADGTFRPDAECTRAQVVTFLWRANGSPKPERTDNPFQDVSSSAYYAKAVLWALENGVTTGKTANTFNPDGECTRAHVVTFLYRDMA